MPVACAPFLKYSRRRSGFTLTEIAIVLLIIGAVLASLWAVIANVNEKSQVTAALEEINAISQGMTSMLQGGYGPLVPAGTIITQPMIASGAIPKSYANNSTTPAVAANNPWQIGNPAALPAPVNLNVQGTGLMLWWIAASTYRMSFYNVDESGCVAMIMQMANCTPGQPGCPIWIWTDLQGHKYDSVNQKLDGGAASLTSDNAQKLCDYNGYPSGNNSVAFDFTQ